MATARVVFGSEGCDRITNDQIQHLAPTTHDHINRFGRYDFHTPTAPMNGQLRPLRN